MEGPGPSDRRDDRLLRRPSPFRGLTLLGAAFESRRLHQITNESSELRRCVRIRATPEVVFGADQEGRTRCAATRLAVFSTGSIAWAGSLAQNAHDDDVSRVTENVVRRFLDAAPFDAPSDARKPGDVRAE